MFKKLQLLIAVSLFSTGIIAQTIVSTTPENRKVVLEEFTGIHCGFCPDGHAIAIALQNANPGNVFLINIHQGGFATPGPNEPDFRTQWGDAIANQTGLTGYPAGTINRSNFPGLEMGASGTTALGRGNWNQAANIILSESSYVNLAVEATIDIPTNSMSIHVEGYYTADSPEATNFLNVAILQNNTLGPQSGGNQGNNYNHQHRLIDLATGQWGEEITTTTQSTFVDRTYSYTFPSSINGLPIEYDELDVVVFMTETTQNIVSGNETTPVINPLTSNNDASLLGLEDLASVCSETSVTPRVNVLNSGLDPITSLDFTYSINGGAAQNYTWTGNLPSLDRITVELPALNYTDQPSNMVNVSIANDDFNDNNTAATIFEGIIDTGGTVDFTITTDQYANEISWEILDGSGNVLYSESLTAANNNQTLEFRYHLPAECITFNLNDSYGDGILGAGGASLIDANGVEIIPFTGNYGSGLSKPFNSDGVLGVDNFDQTTIAIYPNPTNNVLNIVNAENASIEVYDILGKRLLTKSDISQQETISVSGLETGTYFVKIYHGNDFTTKKFIIVN